MANVFITGFERSGTTLLRRIISMWPGYEKDVIHEEKKLLIYKTAQEAENNYFDEYSSIKSGEKIPFYGNVDYVITYMAKFRQFWPDCEIFHIVRHPDAVVDSCKRTFHRPKDVTLRVYVDNMLKMNNYLNEEPNVNVINYDILIQNPKEIVKLIYKILGNVPDDSVIDKIINTKESWELNGKRMCGLRYNNCVGKVKH